MSLVETTQIRTGIFGGGTRIYRSTDGGVTWTSQSLGTGTGIGGDGLPISISDGQLVFDNFGNLFVVYASFDFTVRVKFVSTCVSVIVAFGITAPVLSVTEPNSVAVESCAHADTVIIKITAIAANLIRFITFLPKIPASPYVRSTTAVRASFLRCLMQIICSRHRAISRSD